MALDEELSKGPASATDYVPQYVNLDDVPIRSSQDAFNPDDDLAAGALDGFDNATKRLALREAEGQFESDVNNGETIDRDPLPSDYWAAVRNLASFVLYNPAVDPRYGVNLSTVDEYGSERSTYVDKYLQRYQSLVESINDVVTDTDGDGDLSDELGDGYQPDFEFGTY